MSKTLKTVGTVLGAAALIATGVGAIAGGAILGASLTTIGTIAGIAATAANMGSQALAKPPPARGSVAQAIFDPNALQPYVMGEGYVAAVVRYRVGYGGTVDDVSNPYLAEVHVYSGGGPVESTSPRVDFGTIGSYYTGFLTTDTQLGATPEASALSFSYGTPPGWGAAYKLSGQAAIGWNAKFDKKGKKFASGLPVMGAYGQWAKVYDPRLDSTFPGGSGSHRLGDESTYEYSDNPALHAGTYAYGRYQNSIRTLGIGLPVEGIDFETVAAWATVCEFNSWTIFGRVFEPGDKWANLKDICAAGGGTPIFAGAVLSFRYSAPVVALDTITEADIADEDMSVTAMQSYRDRINTIIPKYISSANNWELVAAEPVQEAQFVTEDGEERREEWPFNLVKNVDQAAVLAAYRLWETRELHPIVLVCKPRLRGYRPGDCLALDLPQLDLDTDAIVMSRSLDPATMKVTLTLIGETPAKHAYILGLTGTPPATPALGQTGEEADADAGVNTLPLGYLAQIISTSYVTDADVSDGLMQATAPSGVVSIEIETHTRTYSDTETPVSVTGATLTHDENSALLATETAYHIAYDNPTRAGGAVTYVAYLDPTDAATSGAHPARHYVGSITTPVTDGTSQGDGAIPPGWSGPSWKEPVV